MESHNHLIDAVDCGFMTEDMRAECNAMAEECLEEVTGLMEYLQSPEGAQEREKSPRAPDRVAPEPRT